MRSHRGFCRHCGHGPVCLRPRGLCHCCSATPAVRRLYPSTSKYGQQSADLGVLKRGKRCSAPTAAPPGSASKLLVLAERVARRENLWHPLDATADAEERSPSAPRSLRPLEVFHVA